MKPHTQVLILNLILPLESPLRVLKEVPPDFGPFGTECGKLKKVKLEVFLNFPWASPLRV
jgi:hypothetical protein